MPADRVAAMQAVTSPRVLLTRNWPVEAVRHLSERFDVTVDETDRPLGKAALAQAMRHFDALCPTVSDNIDAAILGAPGATVRMIGNYGAGYDHIDLAAAKRAGIVVSNTPDVLTDATAELAILLMVMVSRRAGEGERELRTGRWTGWRPTHLMGTGMRGKSLGLVGSGRIAQATARLAQEAFGMSVAYHSRRRADVPGPLAQAEYHPDINTLLPLVDIVSLHCPGGAGTYHMLNRERLKLLRRSAVLINTARGSIVDEAALAEALREGRLAGAGLDVYDREPRVSSELLACENAVLLPHLGSATVETRIAMGMRVATNLNAFFAGRPVPDRIA